MSEVHDIRDAGLDTDDGVLFCDLCFLQMNGPDAPKDARYTIVELRCVCERCGERFEDEAYDLPPSKLVNRSVGLVQRGLYAGARPDPGLNKQLGGR